MGMLKEPSCLQLIFKAVGVHQEAPLTLYRADVMLHVMSEVVVNPLLCIPNDIMLYQGLMVYIVMLISNHEALRSLMKQL